MGQCNFKRVFDRWCLVNVIGLPSAFTFVHENVAILDTEDLAAIMETMDEERTDRLKILSNLKLNEKTKKKSDQQQVSVNDFN